MEALKKVGKYILLEAQEETIIGITWRGAELVNGKIDKNLLADILDPQLTGDMGFVDQYLNQSLVSAKLEHPNILPKIMAVREQEELVSFHEFQEGFTLSRVLDRCQSDGFPFSIDHALLVVSKLLSALSHAKSKHITHGFVNPAMIIVTHEGEIKLKGFALSSALRACRGPVPEMGGYYRKYFPPGMGLDGDQDTLDIFGCGAILYEMLTGEAFHQGSGDPTTRIVNAMTESDGEQIPTQIANILVSALDPNAPTAYSDIQKMAKDMEELLYSGEYSPTTFNLAFFMHSAFRIEMEELGEKIAAERARNYAEPAENAPPVRARAAAPPKEVPREVVTAPVTPAQAKTSSKGSNSKPLIFGATAVLAVIIVLAVVFWPKQPVTDKFEEEKQLLQQEQRDLEAERLRQENEAIQLQNEEYARQLREQAEIEKERKKAELEEEMSRMDEEIQRLNKLKEQEKKQKEIQAELAELERLRAEAAERERLIKEEEARQLEAEAAAKALAEQKKAEEEAKATVLTTEEEELAAEEKLLSEDLEGDPTIPMEAPTPDSIPPEEGELVALDDPFLVHPVLQESYQSVQDAPKKAVKAGVVPRDKNVLFLMRALVNERGRVEEVVLHKSPLQDGQDDFGMIARAEKIIAKIKFSPPTKLGVNVKVWMIVSVQFRGK